MSAESGLKTFRDADGLWNDYPVMQVASHDGWLADPVLVNNFYNGLRRDMRHIEPNAAHKAIASLEDKYEVVVVTQNVDNLHEQAGSTNVVHLHGELMKACSSRNKEDKRCWKTLSVDEPEIAPGELAADGSLLRPYIVFFQEDVPMITAAAEEAYQADVFVIVGTSLNVYPAAGLVRYVRAGVPIYLIDPHPATVPGLPVRVIAKKATEGMFDLISALDEEN